MFFMGSDEQYIRMKKLLNKNEYFPKRSRNFQEKWAQKLQSENVTKL